MVVSLLAVSCRTEPAATAPVRPPGEIPPARTTLKEPHAEGLPAAVISHGLGVNIHFVDPPARDVEMIAAAGFRFVRMDFFWEQIERRKGEYDFAAYEHLVDTLARHGIRPLFILDYGNPLYDNNLAPQTDAGREAFARFAAAGAARFKGRGVLWELWNEPNDKFWHPRPSLDDYMALAKAVFPAMRRADPGATLIAPAAAFFDLDFLVGCFERGLLHLVDAVSVHPYGRMPPEAVTADYHRLRVLIARYAPSGKAELPILSGEWGYSGTWFSREQQGDLLARMFLINAVNGVPLSIWYDWRDDGPNPREAEQNFGTVTAEYQPKPAYVAARTLIQELQGFRFVKRLSLPSDEDYAALFARGDEQKVALWTTGSPHRVALPLDVSAAMVGGKAQPERVRAAADGTLSFEISGRPQYVAPGRPSRALQLAAAWRIESRPAFSADVPATHANAPRLRVTLTNPLDRPLRGQVEAAVPPEIDGGWVGGSRFDLAPGASTRLVWQGTFPRREARSFQIPVTVTVEGQPAPLRDTVTWSVQNPLRIRPSLRADGVLLEIENPSGEPFDGVVALSAKGQRERGREGGRTALRVPGGERRRGLDPTGMTFGDIQQRLRADGRPLTLSGEILSKDGKRALASIPPLTFRGVEWFATPARANAYEAVLEGDAKVPARADLRVVAAPGQDGREGQQRRSAVTAPADDRTRRKPERPNAQGPRPSTQGPIRPTPNAPSACRVEYDFGAGWRFLRVAPRQTLPIEGKPKAVGMWIYNSGSTGDGIRCRFTDANGWTFQPTATEKLTWEGWRWVTMPLDDAHIEHWGGAGAEGLHYPIRWDSLLVVDSPGHAHKGTVYFTGVTLIYEG
jgi:polysaccharide biosynthesis protein PslG